MSSPHKCPSGGIITERDWGWACAEQMESEDTVWAYKAVVRWGWDIADNS